MRAPPSHCRICRVASIPPGPGSLPQLVAGSSVALVYLMIQFHVRPYRTLSDDFVAIVSSFSLVTLLNSLVFFRVKSIAEQEDSRLPQSLRLQLAVPDGLLSGVVAVREHV